MRDLFEQEIIRIIKSKPGIQSVKQITDWMDSTQFWASWNYLHSSEWVLRFNHLLSCTPEDANLDQYFIWLAGIISDIPQHLDKNLSIFRKLKIPNKDLRQSIETLLSKNSQMREHCLKVLECRELVKDIMAAITATEASKIMYFRNYYSHPVLDGYKIVLSYNRSSVAFDSKQYTTYLKNHPGDQAELYMETRKRIDVPLISRTLF